MTKVIRSQGQEEVALIIEGVEGQAVPLVQARIGADGELQDVVGPTGVGGTAPILPNLDESVAAPTKGTIKFWATTDDYNGPHVYFRAKGIYASLSDDESLLAFVARTIGEVGNALTVEYVKPAPESPLAVEVTGNAISVQLATAGAEPLSATLVTTLGVPNAELLFTAKTPGFDSNDISVGYANPTEDTGDTVASADGDAITVALAGDAPVQASITSVDNGIKFSRHDLIGAAGNNLDGFYQLGISADPAGAFSWQHWNLSQYILHTPSDATVQEVIDWVNLHGTEMPHLVTAELISGDGSATIVGMVFGIQYAGGLNAVVTATADDVLAAVEDDVDSSALVDVEHAPANNGTGVVAEYGPVSLSGGADIGFISSTASEVKAAIEANAESNALVSVILQSDETMFEMGETSLSGGDDTTIFEGSIDLSSV